MIPVTEVRTVTFAEELEDVVSGEMGRCPRCGRDWRIGDWPFCAGDPADHEGPHYTFTWGAGGPFTKKG